MLASTLFTPRQWRMRADDLRALAESMRGVEARGIMLRIAEDYARLAKRAEDVPTAHLEGHWGDVSVRLTVPASWRCSVAMRRASSPDAAGADQPQSPPAGIATRKRGSEVPLMVLEQPKRPFEQVERVFVAGDEMPVLIELGDHRPLPGDDPTCPSNISDGLC
jgi:hypothetical protein